MSLNWRFCLDLDLRYRQPSQTAFSYVCWCYTAHQYRLRERMELVFIAFPMKVAVGIVF